MIKLGILAILLVWAAWMWGTLERRSLYFPDRALGANPGAYQLPYEEVHVVTQDGVKVHGWYIPGRNRLTILFSHGNGGNISHRLDKVMLLRQTGVGILLFDYRGFGKSEGRPSEAGTYEDAEAMLRYLTETKGLQIKDIVHYGESLGTAVAVEMAIRHGGAGLILESPFTSTIAMGKLVFPWLPVKWMVRYRYDTLGKIPIARMPLLLMHSPQDEIVPFSMGHDVFAAASNPKQFVELKGGHNDGFATSGNLYTRAVLDFLKGITSHD